MPEPRQRRAFLRRAKRFMTAAHLPVLERYLHWVGAYTPAQKAALYTDDFRQTLGGNDSGHWLREALTVGQLMMATVLLVAGRRMALAALEERDALPSVLARDSHVREIRPTGAAALRARAE